MGGPRAWGFAGSNRLDRGLPRNSLYLQALMSTDVQTPFLGTPLAPLLKASTTHTTQRLLNKKAAPLKGKCKKPCSPASVAADRCPRPGRLYG